MAFNAAQFYQKSSLQTASPAKIILMLYDGAIKFMNKALDGMTEKNIQKTNVNIVKAEKIINELRASLDKKYPVSKDFEAVYELIYRLLIRANVHRDRQALERALEYTKEMRETWMEVMRLNNVR